MKRNGYLLSLAAFIAAVITIAAGPEGLQILFVWTMAFCAIMLCFAPAWQLKTEKPYDMTPLSPEERERIIILLRLTYKYGSSRELAEKAEKLKTEFFENNQLQKMYEVGEIEIKTVAQ